MVRDEQRPAAAPTPKLVTTVTWNVEDTNPGEKRAKILCPGMRFELS